MARTSDAWLGKAEQLVREFEAKHGLTYRRTKREVYASFEIGCLISLVDYYHAQGLRSTFENLQRKDGTEFFRYHTTPSGNPDNFSWIQLERDAEHFQIRQQVRIQSHLDPDIRFTPDIVVLRSHANYLRDRDQDYAGGKRTLFCVEASDVVAAHECKSMQPFPELLVGFLGMLVAGHQWLSCPTDKSLETPEGIHLAPTLFVGGTARGLHQRMVAALCRTYPMNAVLGLHSGSWNLQDNAKLKRMRTPEFRSQVVPA